jgi:hypothetical protein
MTSAQAASSMLSSSGLTRYGTVDYPKRKMEFNRAVEKVTTGMMIVRVLEEIPGERIASH